MQAGAGTLQEDVRLVGASAMELEVWVVLEGGPGWEYSLEEDSDLWLAMLQNLPALALEQPAGSYGANLERFLL